MENGRLAYVEAEFPRASVTRTRRWIVDGAGSGELSAETRQKNARSTTSKVAPACVDSSTLQTPLIFLSIDAPWVTTPSSVCSPTATSTAPPRICFASSETLSSNATATPVCVAGKSRALMTAEPTAWAFAAPEEVIETTTGAEDVQ